MHVSDTLEPTAPEDPVTETTRPSALTGIRWTRTAHTQVWTLRAPGGTYTVLYTGFDYLVRLDGVRDITRRGGLYEAMGAAEDHAVANPAPVPPDGPPIVRAALAKALLTELDLAYTALPDPKIDARLAVVTAVRAIGATVGLTSAEYDPHLTAKEK